MIHFTSYAEKKFTILNNHGVYFTKEEIEDVVSSPQKSTKKDKYLFLSKDNKEVICEQDEKVIRVITFYPIKN